MTKKLKLKDKKSYWVNKIDELFSELVKNRDGWKCIETNATSGLNTAHIISRDYHAIRWSFNNAVTLSVGRHKYYTHHPVEWKRFINQKFGQGYYEALEYRALGRKTYSLDDLKDLYEQFKNLRANCGQRGGGSGVFTIQDPIAWITDRGS